LDAFRLLLVCTFVVEDTDTPCGDRCGGAGPWNLTPRHDPSVKHSLDWIFVPVDPWRLKSARFLLVCTFVVEDTDTPSEGGGGGAGPWNKTPRHDPLFKHSFDMILTSFACFKSKLADLTNETIIRATISSFKKLANILMSN
jgi:hypothetical protein